MPANWKKCQIFPWKQGIRQVISDILNEGLSGQYRIEFLETGQESEAFF